MLRWLCKGLSDAEGRWSTEAECFNFPLKSGRGVEPGSNENTGLSSALLGSGEAYWLSGVRRCGATSRETSEFFRDRDEAGRNACKKLPMRVRGGRGGGGSSFSSSSGSGVGIAVDFHKIRSHLKEL